MVQMGIKSFKWRDRTWFYFMIAVTRFLWKWAIFARTACIAKEVRVKKINYRIIGFISLCQQWWAFISVGNIVKGNPIPKQYFCLRFLGSVPGRCLQVSIWRMQRHHAFSDTCWRIVKWTPIFKRHVWLLSAIEFL